MSEKRLDAKNRWRNVVVAFRMSPEEAQELNVKVSLSGLSKQDYIIQCLLKHEIRVVGGMKVAKKVQVHLDTILEELQTLDEADRGIDVEELLVPLKHTILNQVTLILKYKTDEVGESIFLDAKMSEEDKKNERRLSEDEKNERRLSEALSEVMTASDYKKVEAIILYLEDNKYVTPQIAEKLTGKSAPTVRRYLKMLVETGYVKVDGSTSNIKYVI